MTEKTCHELQLIGGFLLGCIGFLLWTDHLGLLIGLFLFKLAGKLMEDDSNK